MDYEAPGGTFGDERCAFPCGDGDGGWRCAAAPAGYRFLGDLRSADPAVDAPFTPPIPHKSYAFDNKGWGVNLDMEQPVNRQTELKDVTAGAYFKIGPRLKLGGSVVLGDRFAQPQQLTPQDTGPRVHLETKFQF